MALNPVQIKHVSEVIRPMLEKVILALDDFDTFAAEYDALQSGPNALPETAVALDDGPDGQSPRTDAPQITGAQVRLLRDKVVAMSGTLTAPQKQGLIDAMVRDLATIRG